jgi:hypothetical protein
MTRYIYHGLIFSCNGFHGAVGHSDFTWTEFDKFPFPGLHTGFFDGEGEGGRQRFKFDDFESLNFELLKEESSDFRSLYGTLVCHLVALGL